MFERDVADRRHHLGVTHHAVERADGQHRKLPRCRFAGQHDRVDPIVDRVRGVAHLRPRRTRLRPHRLEHLGRDDDGNAPCARLTGDLLLHARHALERQFQPEVPARHHDCVARGEDLVDLRDALGPFELRNEQCLRRPGSRQGLARVSQVRCALYETQRDVIDAHPDTKFQILGILRRQTRRWQHDARDVDPLVLAQQTAIDDCRDNLVALNGIHAQLNVPVIQQQRVACGNHFRQVVRRRHASVPHRSRRRIGTALTRDITDHDAQRVAATKL